VFSDVPFAGNGLIVAFGGTRTVRAEALVLLTAELRQFELIVVDAAPQTGRVSARIFTAQEELPFAGHPVIGAAAALHERHAAEPARSWVFVIAGREIAVRSEQTERYYKAEMNRVLPPWARRFRVPMPLVSRERWTSAAAICTRCRCESCPPACPT